MRHFVLGLIVLAFQLSMESYADAEQFELAPRWAGTFSGHYSNSDDYFHVLLKEIRTDGDMIVARGRARFFDDERITDVTVAWRIDLESWSVEMFDSNPVGDDKDYVTSGVYRGSISRKMDKIIALWHDPDTRSSGTLQLRVVERFPDRGIGRPELR